MKKSLVVIILLSVLCGCQEDLQVSNAQEQLVKPPSDWIEKYGDNLESQQTANIVLAIQVINRQGKAIKQLDKRLDVLEDPNK